MPGLLPEVETLLANAVKASLPLGPHLRLKFVAQYVRAKLEAATLPIADGEEVNFQTLASELEEMSTSLTVAVNAARNQAGWPLEAITLAIAAQAERAEAMHAQKARTNNVEKAAALEAALKIAEEHKASCGGKYEELLSLEISRAVEERWGDREIALLAKSLERPQLDEQLHTLLATRQRLEDARQAGTGDIRELDKALGVLGVAFDGFGMWREGDDDTLDVDKKMGVTGSGLLIEEPGAVTSLTIGAKEIRGGDALGALLLRLPALLTLRIAHCPFLSSLPESLGALPKLRQLDLTGATRLPTLPEAALGRLTELQSLDLTSCESLTALPPTVANLTSLKSFAVTQTPRDVEAALAEMEAAEKEEGGAVNRRRNTRAAIEGPGILALPDALCALSSLQHLTLGLPGLKKLPDAFGQLPGLQTLSLAGSTGLSALWHEEGCKLSSLKYLELPDAPATRLLPDGVLLPLQQLQVLDLYSCTSMASLPESIGALKALDCLYIGSLEMSTLPDGIGKCEALTHLDLRLPSLAALPEALGGLAKLTSLHVTHAAMSALPESMGKLSRLEVLKLSRCAQLATLSDSLSQCESLKYLELTQCTALTALPKGLGALPQLFALDFPGCDELGDTLYDDPIVDELEAKGCGFFGPGIEIETAKYVAVKSEVDQAEEERKGRVAAMRSES